MLAPYSVRKARVLSLQQVEALVFDVLQHHAQSTWKTFHDTRLEQLTWEPSTVVEGSVVDPDPDPFVMKPKLETLQRSMIQLLEEVCCFA